MKLSTNPLIQVTLYSALVAFFFGLVYLTPLRVWLHDYIWMIFLFLYSLAFSTTGMIHLTQQNNPANFRKYYLIIISIRTLVAMIILAYAVYLNVFNLKIFTINYFFIYMIFVVFEVFRLRIDIRR